MDSKLGATEASVKCPTCGNGYVTCPGHCGHIELDVPVSLLYSNVFSCADFFSQVYHPLLFRSLFTMLRCKCVFCHRLVSLPRLYRIADLCLVWKYHKLSVDKHWWNWSFWKWAKSQMRTTWMTWYNPVSSKTTKKRHTSKMLKNSSKHTKIATHVTSESTLTAAWTATTRSFSQSLLIVFGNCALRWRSVTIVVHMLRHFVKMDSPKYFWSRYPNVCANRWRKWRWP